MQNGNHLHPASLSVRPVRVELGQSQYSTKTQVRVYENTGPLTITWNGTQTYGFDGRPNDADHDR